MLPKLIFTDIDGVWTDGGMYYDEQGNELKKFNTYDSAGVLLCKILNIPFGIITGENTKSVQARAKKLKADYLFLNEKNKADRILKLCEELNVDIKEVAYIGDDINDYHLLRIVGLSASPASAPEYIKRITHWKLDKRGGEGVFREFVEKIILENKLDIVSLLKEHKIISDTFPQ